MRLDKRLLVLLLAKLEALPLPYGTVYVLSHQEAEVQVDGYDLDTIGYHLDKLRDMGLIDAPGPQPAMGVTFAGLSVEGHQYLERARDSTATAPGIDKQQFIDLAPRYYALAIICHFQRLSWTTTRSAIIEAYTIPAESPGDIAHERLKNTRFFDLGLAYLEQEGMVTVEKDHLGPSLISPTKTFDMVWTRLKEEEQIFGRYDRAGDGGFEQSRSWLLAALDQLGIQALRLSINDEDIDRLDTEWAPIPVERSSAEVRAVIDAVDAAVEQIRSDNGYTATKPEERDYVVDSLSTFAKRVREEATISRHYVRVFALEPLARALKSLGRSATGLLVEVAKAKIKEWLMKFGWPTDWPW